MVVEPAGRITVIRPIVWLLLCLIVVHDLGAQTTTADSLAVAALVRSHEAAMDAGNAELLRPDYGPMTLWVNSAGVRRIGQDAIVSYLGRFFADSGAGAARSGTGDSVTVFVLGERTAYARRILVREATRINDSPTTPAIRTHVMFLLAKDDGRWTIQQELIADELPTTRTLPVGAFDGFRRLRPISQSRCDAPRFPKALSKTGFGGVVVLQYVVGVDGRVEDETFRVISSPNAVFEAPAIATVKSCSFKPARFFNVPVRQRVQQGVSFSPPGQRWTDPPPSPWNDHSS